VLISYFPPVSEEIMDCTPVKERLNIINVSNFEFVSLNDTTSYMNGSITYNREIKSPWKMTLELLKYDRGEWLLTLKKTFNDLCPDLHNPLSPAYVLSKTMPRCPIPANVSV
jgi:hypothetical protein